MSVISTAMHSGYVALVGRPNVGKSSLLNTMLGQQIAPVTPRPQTTRRNQLGILSVEGAQIVFLDTPGIHKPVNKLGTFMNEEAENAIRDADILALLVDISQVPKTEDIIVAERLKAIKNDKPCILIGNKADLVPSDRLEQALEPFARLFECSSRILVSAVSGWHVDELLSLLIKILPEGEPFYDHEKLTDLYERDIAADLIRAACLRRLREEVPYSIAVRMDTYKERANGVIYIEATIFVEKESQKGIVIGSGGMMLKEIGKDARLTIEEMTACQVYLDLRVKVEKNWRNDINALKRFGYRSDR
ncbi:MAG: GTPase Era [Anaerolineaceae bacterium]